MLRLLSLASLAFVASACSCDPPAREVDASGPPTATPEPPPVDPRTEVLRDWLRAGAVSHAHAARSIVYAWVTEARLEQLRDGAPLLPTPTTEEGSALDRALEGDTSRFAELVRTDESLRGRLDAWPTPWASRLASDADRLLRIELSNRALIATYDASTRAVGFFTDQGNTAPFEEGMRVPQFWAAVYLVVPGDAGDCWSARARGPSTGVPVEGTDGSGPCARAVDHPPSRSLVLIHEELIARVSYGTPEIAAELSVERERLGLLATRMDESSSPFSNVLGEWDDIPPHDATTRRLYDSVLSVASDAYVPTEPHVRAIVAALGEQPRPSFVRATP